MKRLELWHVFVVVVLLGIGTALVLPVAINLDAPTEIIDNTGDVGGAYCVTAILRNGTWAGQTFADSVTADSVYLLMLESMGGPYQKFNHGGWGFTNQDIQMMRFKPTIESVAPYAEEK